MNQAEHFSHPLLLLSTALSYLSTVLANWDAYDKCANDALNQYVPQSCLFGSNNSTATQKGNACLCPNIPFIANVAYYLYRDCECDVLGQMAAIFVSSCNSTSTPAPYNESQIAFLGSNQT
jgi:hypothetical protein